jgi:hypothetical protein
MYGKLSWLPHIYEPCRYYWWLRAEFSAREFVERKHNEQTTRAKTAAPSGHAAAWDCRWG